MGDQWKPDDKPVFTNHDVLYQQATKILEVVYISQTGEDFDGARCKRKSE